MTRMTAVSYLGGAARASETTFVPANVLALVGVSGVSPAISEYARRWNADQASWRDAVAEEPAPESPVD
jgi:hypothetical protein